MRGKGTHPLRAGCQQVLGILLLFLEEGVLEGTPGETRELSRGQSMQGPVGHHEGFGPYPQSN